jgi:hypothetical protein
MKSLQSRLVDYRKLSVRTLKDGEIGVKYDIQYVGTALLKMPSVSTFFRKWGRCTLVLCKWLQRRETVTYILMMSSVKSNTAWGSTQNASRTAKAAGWLRVQTVVRSKALYAQIQEPLLNGLSGAKLKIVADRPAAIEGETVDELYLSQT